MVGVGRVELLLTTCLYVKFGILRCFFFSSRRRHTRWTGDWSSDVCSSDLTPRIANRLLRRVRDYAQVRAAGAITLDVAHAGLKLLEVDEHGFDEVDRKLLRTIIDKFGGGPVGLNKIGRASCRERVEISGGA